MWETIRGYLTFTRKERYGVLFLLLAHQPVICSALFFYTCSPGDPDPEAYKKLQRQRLNWTGGYAIPPTSSVSHERYEPRKFEGRIIATRG